MHSNWFEHRKKESEKEITNFFFSELELLPINALADVFVQQFIRLQ